jgi:tetratricopeptide (TPR) repeat protein
MNRKQRRNSALQRRRSSSLLRHLEKPASADRISKLMPLARKHHQSDRLTEAERLYREILAIQPNHVDALHLLGVVANQTGRNELAVDLLGRAIALDCQVAAFHSNMASALRSLGRKDEAVTHLRRAIALKPDHFDALWALAESLHELGALEEAERVYRSVLAVRPEHAEAHNNLGALLEDQGKHAEAIEHFQQVLRANPESAEAQYNLGYALFAQGELQESVKHFQQALAVRPQMAEGHQNLANTLVKLGKVDEAVIHYKQALAIKPDSVEVCNNLGNAMRTLSKLDEAIAYYRQALAIKPNHASAFNNLGHALRELGKLTEARTAYEKAVELAPEKTLYHNGLAIMKRFAPGDQQLATMERIALDAESLPAQDRIYLHFALARAYDGIGDYERAFDHLLQGNALKRREIHYHEAWVHGRLARIAEVFSPSLIHAKRGLGDHSRVPVFVVGMPRSGTSLVEQILASHPKVFGAGELKTLMDSVSISFPDEVSSMGGLGLREIGTKYIAEVRRLSPNAERIVDKMPANYRFAGFIHLALPNARIIHVYRNPLDTCLSCFSTLFVGEQPYSYDLGELGRYYRAYEKSMEHWRRVLPSGVMLEVQYEQLIENLEGEARRLIAHCGLEWDAACLSFHETERPVRTASAQQVRQPVYRSSIGRWRPYARHLRPLMEALGADVADRSRSAPLILAEDVGEKVGEASPVGLTDDCLTAGKGLDRVSAPTVGGSLGHGRARRHGRETSLGPILIDTVNTISLHNNLLRIDCATVGANREEQSVNCLLIPGNRAGSILRSLTQAMEELDKKAREQVRLVAATPTAG